MEKFGNIEIIIRGSKGNLEINPDLYDIKDVISLLENVEDLILPSNKKDRPVISYKIENGSVKNIFRTSLQIVISFNALLFQINETKSIDFLEYPTAKSMEYFQKLAIKNDYSITLSTSLEISNQLNIDKETKYLLNHEMWVDAEFYFYGTIYDLGGKNKANVHIDTDNIGTLTITTNKELLAAYEGNPLYKKYGIRATGKQNIETGEIDKSTLVLIDIIDYSPKYDDIYIKNLISKAKKNWIDLEDPDQWVRELRGIV
jgi:hypothetical protein